MSQNKLLRIFVYAQYDYHVKMKIMSTVKGFLVPPCAQTKEYTRSDASGKEVFSASTGDARTVATFCPVICNVQLPQ